MQLSQVLQNVVIALCAMLSLSPFPPITSSISSVICTTILNALSPSPPPTCPLVLFPQPALVGLMLEGRHVLTQSDLIPYHHLIPDINFRQPIHDDGDSLPGPLYFLTKATHCLDLRVSRNGLCVLVCFAIILIAYCNKSLSPSHLSVQVVYTPLDKSASITHVTQYSDSVSTNDTPSQNGIFVSLAHRRQQSVLLTNLETLLLQYLITQQLRPGRFFLPLYFSDAICPSQFDMVPSACSFSSDSGSFDYDATLIPLPNLFHNVFFRILVIMPGGWGIFTTTGVLVVNSSIIALLSRVRDGNFQTSIWGINFNCQFTFVLCNKQFILELSLTSDVVGFVIGWYPSQISWYTDNALQGIMASVPQQQLDDSKKKKSVRILTRSGLISKRYNTQALFISLLKSPSTFHLCVRLAPLTSDRVQEPSLHGLALIPYLRPVLSQDDVPSSTAVTEVQNDSTPDPLDTNDNVDEVSESCSPPDERRIPRKERRAQRIKGFRDSDWFKQQKKESKKERARVRAQQRAAQQAEQAATTNPAPANGPDSSLRPPSSDDADNNGGPSTSARPDHSQN